jgi:hypothetical protein
VPDELILREKAREAIRSGDLPISAPSRTFGGPGADQPCAVCGQTIPRDQMEFEIEFRHDSAAPGMNDVRHLHPRCFAAWEFERAKVAVA